MNDLAFQGILGFVIGAFSMLLAWIFDNIHGDKVRYYLKFFKTKQPIFVTNNYIEIEVDLDRVTRSDELIVLACEATKDLCESNHIKFSKMPKGKYYSLFEFKITSERIGECDEIQNEKDDATNSDQTSNIH